MLEFPRWKYVVILLVVLLSALYALPNIYPQDPSVQITANRGATIDAALRQKVRGDAARRPASRRSRSRSTSGNLLVRLRDARCADQGGR